MKLKTILGVSMALVLTSAITAQDEERNFMGAAYGINQFSVDLYGVAGYPNATTMFIIGFDTLEGDGRITLPAALGGGVISVHAWGAPIMAPSDSIGGTHLKLQFNTDVLAFLRSVAYVQVLSINSPDWTGSLASSISSVCRAGLSAWSSLCSDRLTIPANDG